MTITDDRQRAALETLLDCCTTARDSSAISTLVFVARPLTTEYDDPDDWAEQQVAKSPSGHDFGFWKAKGIEFRQDRIQNLALTLANLTGFLQHLRWAGLREACGEAGLYADDKQGGLVTLGSASGRAYAEAVTILVERWLRSAGVCDIDELPDDLEEAASQLAKMLLRPVWDDGRETLSGVRVAQKVMASLEGVDVDAIRLVLETECAKIERLLGQLGPDTETGSKHGDEERPNSEPEGTDVESDGKSDNSSTAACGDDAEPPGLKPKHYEVLRVMQTHPMDSWPKGKVAAGRKDATSRGPVSQLLDDLAHPQHGFVVFKPEPGHTRSHKTPATLTKKGREFEIPEDRLPQY